MTLLTAFFRVLSCPMVVIMMMMMWMMAIVLQCNHWNFIEAERFSWPSSPVPFLVLLFFTTVKNQNPHGILFLHLLFLWFTYFYYLSFPCHFVLYLCLYTHPIFLYCFSLISSILLVYKSFIKLPSISPCNFLILYPIQIDVKQEHSKKMIEHFFFTSGLLFKKQTLKSCRVQQAKCCAFFISLMITMRGWWWARMSQVHLVALHSSTAAISRFKYLVLNLHPFFHCVVLCYFKITTGSKTTLALCPSLSLSLILTILLIYNTHVRMLMLCLFIGKWKKSWFFIHPCSSSTHNKRNLCVYNRSTIKLFFFYHFM